MTILSFACSCSSADFTSSGSNSKPLQNSDDLIHTGDQKKTEDQNSKPNVAAEFGAGTDVNLSTGEGDDSREFLDSLVGADYSTLNFNMEMGNDADFNDLSVCFEPDDIIFRLSDNRVYALKDATVPVKVKQIIGDTKDFRITVNDQTIIEDRLSYQQSKSYQIELKMGDEMSVLFANKVFS